MFAIFPQPLKVNKVETKICMFQIFIIVFKFSINIQNVKYKIGIIDLWTLVLTPKCRVLIVRNVDCTSYELPIQ